MSLSGAKCSALLVLLSNVLFSWISGALLVLFGAVYLYDPSYLPFFHLLAIGIATESTLILFSLCIVGLGAFVITLGLFGCFGTLAENHCILRTYVYLLLIVFLVEVGVAAGCLFLYLSFPTYSESLQINLMTEFQQFYSSSTHADFTDAFDSTQHYLRCCGVYNYTDYELTNWKNVQDNSSLRVPQSCCSSKPLISYGDDDRENELFLEEGGAAATTRRWDDGDETDWLERCQSSNPMESGDFLYDQGCWTPLTTVFYQNTMFSFILFASLALVQLIGVTLSICLARKLRDQRDLSTIRETDAKVSEPLLL